MESSKYLKVYVLILLKVQLFLRTYIMNSHNLTTEQERYGVLTLFPTHSSHLKRRIVINDFNT